jgi:hypothetical protein
MIAAPDAEWMGLMVEVAHVRDWARRNAEFIEEYQSAGTESRNLRRSAFVEPRNYH